VARSGERWRTDGAAPGEDHGGLSGAISVSASIIEPAKLAVN
jgi:hypothetical protein